MNNSTGDLVKTCIIQSFKLSATPVTNFEFQQFIESTGYITVGEREGSTFFDDQLGWQIDPKRNWKHPAGINSSIKNILDHPVVCVTYLDVQEYCKWSNTRLPSEIEWEYASTLSSNKESDMNIYRIHTHTTKDTFKTTSPVRYFTPSKEGIYCQLGNVWEICDNAYYSNVKADSNPLTSIEIVDPKDSLLTKTTFIVIKGGSFLCHKNYCYGYHSGARQSTPSTEAFFHIGFRVIKK